MVTETEHPLNDRNNNNVSSYPPRTPMTKHKMVEDDGEKEKADDIKIHDEGDNDDDNDNNNKDIDEDDTDDENIDVGVEESDMDDQNASDPESSPGGNEMIHPVVMTHRLRHEDFHGLRTNATSRLPGGLPRGLPDGLASGLPGCVVPIPSLPPPHLHLHPSTPFHTTPQSLFLHGFHQPPNDPSRSNSNSPQQNTKHNNNNNDNNNSNNNDINIKNTKTNPLSISPKTNFISKLSFGIDRILNENNNNHHHHHSRSPNNLCKPTAPRERHESAEDAHQSQSDEEDPDDDNTNSSSIPRRHPPPPPPLSSFSSHRVHVITDPVHVQASSSSLTSPTTVLTPNRLPPRMIPGVDLVSPLSPFHGAVLPRDVCRVDPPSLDILPVRPAWPDVYVCPWTGVQRDRFGLVRRVGHPYQNRTPPKRKKPRTAFSRQQVLELEKRFTRQKYLASAERSALAKTLSMTDAQVKTWFQNRRTKWRRQTAEEREIERQAAHKFLLSLRPEDPNRPNIAAYGALCGVNQQGPQSVTEAPKSPGASSVN